MSLLFLLFFISPSLSLIESSLEVHHVVLEPIYRFTETAEDPLKGIYFTKLPQFASVTQTSSLLNISNFPAVRGLTKEMFLKDLNCSVATCQNLPIEVLPVYSVIDSSGRLKFETTPTGDMHVLAKAGYLAKDEYVGLVRYDEYFSEKDNLFAYANGNYPNQFGACQLRKYGEYRFKQTRTLGYAFTAITIPNNTPIYSIFGFDDGLPDPSTSTPSPNSVVFTTNPIWTIRKNSTYGRQGLGAINLPWTPPVAATPLDPTGICLLNGNLSLLRRCGDADRVLQYFDDNHTYIGFIDIANQGVEDTYIYSYIGFMFRNSENACDLPLKPIREFYIEGLGYTATVSDEDPQGYSATGRVIGYTIDCQDAPNGNISVMLPDGSFSSTTSSWTLSTTSRFSEETGFYVEPVKIVRPSNSSGSTGNQGTWWGNSSGEGVSILNSTNICLFVANSTSLAKCGYASTLYLFHDISDNFFFIGIQSLGRNVTRKAIGLAFSSSENVCGLNLVPIKELYKEGVGYSATVGEDLLDGYELTGNVLGYTVRCSDAVDENWVIGHVPSFEFSTTSVSTNSSDLVGIYVTPVFNVTGGMEGYTGRSVEWPYSLGNPIPICLFVANSSFLKTCGDTENLYQFFDIDKKFYFIGTDNKGRNVTSMRIGLAFKSAENLCGLKLKPIRELYKEGVGYTAVAGNNYTHLTAAGYSLTGNVMGFTVKCSKAIDKMICAHLPAYNWTTPRAVSTADPSTDLTTKTPEDCDGKVFVDNMFLIENPSILGSQGFNYWINPPFINKATLEVCYFAPEWMSAVGAVNEPSAPEWFSECGQTVNLYHYLDPSENYHFLSIDPFGRNVTETEKAGIVFKTDENKCGLDLLPLREVYKDGTGYSVVAGLNTLYTDGYRETGKILGYALKCGTEGFAKVCLKRADSITTTAPFVCNPNAINWGRGNTRPEELSVTYSDLRTIGSLTTITVNCNADAEKWMQVVFYPYQENPIENDLKIQNQSVVLECHGDNKWYYRFPNNWTSSVIQGYMCFQYDLYNKTTTVLQTTRETTSLPSSTTLLTSTPQPTTIIYGVCHPNNITFEKADGMFMVDVHIDSFSISGPTSTMTISCSSPPGTVFMEFNVNKGGPPVAETVTVQLTCNAEEQTWVYTAVVNGISYSMDIESVRCNRASG